MTFDLQPASEADLGEIERLAQEIWRACFPPIIGHAQVEYMLATFYPAAVQREWLRSERASLDKLMADGVCRGFAAHGPASSPGDYKLHRLYVHPALQGAGAGGALLQQVETAARSAGARFLILAVNKRNDPARRFYDRHGFRVRAESVTPIGSGFVMDDFVLEKPLVPSG